MNINENGRTYILNQESIEKIKNLINLIIFASEKAENIFKLNELEKNEIEIISNLLEILSDFNNCMLNLKPIQNFFILSYIKNTLPKYKAKPKMKNVEHLEDKILNGIKFYLNYNFSQNYSIDKTFEKIKKMFDEIIPLLFDFIVVMEKPKNFLIKIYNNIFLEYLNNPEKNSVYDEFFIKFIYAYENFSRIYLIYIYKNEEMNIVFKKYYLLLDICNNNTKEHKSCQLLISK